MSNNNMKFEHSMQELAELFEVNTFVNQTFVLDEFIEKLSDYISEKVNLNQISFYVFENEIFKLVPTKQNSFNDEYFELESGNDALWAVLSSRKLVKTFEEEQVIFKRFLRNHDKDVAKTRYVATFFDKHTPAAFCFIGKDANGEDLSQERVDFLEKVFGYVEPVIIKFLDEKRKETRIQDLQKSLYNISILYNISQAVNFIDDLNRLLQVILDKALSTLEAEKGSLMLYDYSTNSLQVKVVYGLPDKKTEDAINNGTIRCSSIKPGEGIAGSVFIEKKPIITNLGSADPRFSQKVTISSTKTLLCVPLIVKGETIGVINISNKKNNKLFNQKDMEFMSSLANQAAIAIDNAKLYELATRDGLTKLYIARHFYTLLENEIRRCIRYKHKMSLVMIDIDNFKGVNDTYGHLTGDIILREVAAKISSTVRKIDIPARYGGEEFVVILPETKKNDALIIAERLRKSVAEIVVKTAEGYEIRPTASFGVAEHPIDGIDAKTIINSADTALYHSKHNGKNVVSIFYKDGSIAMRDVKDEKSELSEQMLNELNSSL